MPYRPANTRVSHGDQCSAPPSQTMWSHYCCPSCSCPRLDGLRIRQQWPTWLEMVGYVFRCQQWRKTNKWQGGEGELFSDIVAQKGKMNCSYCERMCIFSKCFGGKSYILWKWVHWFKFHKAKATNTFAKRRQNGRKVGRPWLVQGWPRMYLVKERPQALTKIENEKL